MEVLDEDLTDASKPKRGRPSLEEKVHRIGLGESVLNLWLVRKHDAGFQDKTNSEFAEFLLKVSGEKFDVPVPQSSPATPSNHAAMGKFKYYYIFQQCFLELYLLDQVKCQLFYFFLFTQGHCIQLLRVKHTLYHHSFIQLPVQCLEKMKTCK